MNTPSPIVKLFVKYLRDQCTAEEIKELSLYFENEENEAVLKSLIRAELDFAHQGAIVDSKEDAALLKIRSALLAQIKEDRKPRRPVFIPRWLKICAVWLVIAGSTAVLAGHFYTAIEGYFHPAKLYTMVTRPGERKSLTLADGTKIWLSPSSALEYPDRLTGNLREVKLEGEAFFEVAKDKKHPFIIHSDRMDTRVVGTSFTIQSYKHQPAYTVTVVTGTVNVSALSPSGDKTATVVLKPNQRSRLDNQSGALASTNYPAAGQMLKRKDGILSYDGAPVQEVIADFARYYKVRIVVESKSMNCLCYGEFNTNRPAKIVLEQLAAAINAELVIQKDWYILKGGCEE